MKGGPDSPSDPDVHRKCARCSKYELRRLWCPIRAEMRPPEAPACRYGVVLMGAARQKECGNGRGEKEA